jgi:hypothetical protein
VDGPRVVGPGRRERAYLSRIRALELDLEERGRERERLVVGLDTSRRLERGCQALLDRMEEHAALEREERRSLEQRERRMILVLGALQKENELLREQLALGSGAGDPQLAAPPHERRARRTGARRPGLWRRLFARG